MKPYPLARFDRYNFHLPEASCTKLPNEHRHHVRSMLTVSVFQNTEPPGITSRLSKIEQPIPLNESWQFPEEDQEYDITLNRDWGEEAEFMGEGESKWQFPSFVFL